MVPSVVVLEDYQVLSAAAAELVAEQLAAKPDAAVVVATGETPMGLYGELARRKEVGSLDASALRVFQLDEYLGIGADDPRSLFGWMVRGFLDPLGIPRDRAVRLPNDGNVERGCAVFDREVDEAGGFDLAILGVGPNGHIGFNEPPSDADAPTREVALADETVRSNARYWGGPERVPLRAVTVGMRQLLGSRHIVLLASGRRKRHIVDRMLHGPVTPDVPASFLRRAERATVVLDRDAARGRET